jgi:hypothetical protein
MGRVEDLAAQYEKYICVPWQRTIVGAQRVVLVVYEKELERSLRARIAEFEQRTTSAGHGWIDFDCTCRFAEWMADDEYKDAYFEVPEDLAIKVEGEFLDMLVDQLRHTLREADENTVVSMTGVASLYGFVHVSAIIRAVEPDIPGRLVIFFPGSADGHNLRLLDARDGWNYLATVITLHGVGAHA